MIELHERLSEFSYGYGVTRAVELLLETLGMRAVPFMPSLIHEKAVGFDVGFKKRGAPLLLQFKMGQSLTRFVRTDAAQPKPSLQRPFFRFSVDTAEEDGQYETLLKSQIDGAEVYYVAPRFADWPHYVRLFENDTVLEHSVMVRPTDIRDALTAAGSADGHHRIVYDATTVHVCSAPVRIPEVSPITIGERIAHRLRTGRQTLGEEVRRIYAGLENRAAVRREQPKKDPGARSINTHIVSRPDFDSALEERSPSGQTRFERSHRLVHLQARSRSDEDAIAAALGLELWGLGIQLLFAVEQGDRLATQAPNREA